MVFFLGGGGYIFLLVLYKCVVICKHNSRIALVKTARGRAHGSIRHQASRELGHCPMISHYYTLKTQTLPLIDKEQSS